VSEAGVDEAGRGPAIGPLVVACVVLDSAGLAFLRGYVKDSKLLTPRARSRIYRLIEAAAEEIKLKVLEPREVDWAVENLPRGLNELEAAATAELIDSLENPVEVVYVDSPDPLPGRYAEMIKSRLRRAGVEVVAANRAETLYPHVAAASIVAKVVRDGIVEGLKREYGDFGSGYPSDPKTRSFIERFLREGAELPPIVRRSWKTLDRLKLG
jgi:ribonuclease HII